VKHKTHSRRDFLGSIARMAVAGAALTLAPPILASQAHAALAKSRSLTFENLHTGKRLDIVYSLGDRYVPEALSTLNTFLFDHYSGRIGRMDPKLFDLLYRLKVISAYRCPSTNQKLRATRQGGVAKKSLHMVGKAIDMRLADVSLKDLRDAARRIRSGGVGYYPKDGFVHVDTGPVRTW
jgi:uncharacterized protein YcbK (DUF882 family)